MRKSTITRQERVCPATGESFIPIRDNQTYLNPAVQIKNNNDRAKLKRMELKKFNDNINANVKILAKLYDYMLLCKWNSIPVEYIDYEGLKFEAYTSTTKIANSKKIVYWCLNYGFEPVDEKMKYYYIYKK
jgi:hypothetical protein